MNREFFVPHAALPEEQAARETLLQSYFCDLTASAEPVTSGWRITLGRPDKPEHYVDPQLDVGLAWWRNAIGPIEIPDLLVTTHNDHGFLLAFNDAWTLYGWSPQLNRQNRLIIMHADDHDDLMSPRLTVEDNIWTDILTNRSFDLRDPLAVSASIHSGAIGMGSFLVPVLHAAAPVTLRHFTHSDYAQQRGTTRTLQPVFQPDTLLRPGEQRPAVRFEPLAAGTTSEYIATASPHMCTEDLVDGPILLHIDMDCFNNRYNGDSDRLTVGPKYDPPLERVLDDIDAYFGALDPYAHRIVSCVVALSPGFFPATFWEPSIDRVREHIARFRATGRWYA